MPAPSPSEPEKDGAIASASEKELGIATPMPNLEYPIEADDTFDHRGAEEEELAFRSNNNSSSVKHKERVVVQKVSSTYYRRLLMLQMIDGQKGEIEEEEEGVEQGDYVDSSDDDDDGIVHAHTCSVWLARQARSLSSQGSSHRSSSRLNKLVGASVIQGGSTHLVSSSSNGGGGGIGHGGGIGDSPPRQLAITLPHEESEEEGENEEVKEERGQQQGGGRGGYGTPLPSHENGMEALEAGALIATHADLQAGGAPATQGEGRGSSLSRPVSSPLSSSISSAPSSLSPSLSASASSSTSTTISPPRRHRSHPHHHQQQSSMLQHHSSKFSNSSSSSSPPQMVMHHHSTHSNSSSSSPPQMVMHHRVRQHHHLLQQERELSQASSTSTSSGPGGGRRSNSNRSYSRGAGGGTEEPHHPQEGCRLISALSIGSHRTPSPPSRHRTSKRALRHDSDEVLRNDDEAPSPPLPLPCHEGSTISTTSSPTTTPPSSATTTAISRREGVGGGSASSSTSPSTTPTSTTPESWGQIWHMIVKPVQQMTPQRVFFCNICLSNVNESERMIHRGENACSHAFCKDCIKGYMQASISQRGVSIPCPMLGQNGCAYSYSVEDIDATVDADTKRKFEKFSLMAQSDRYRECPKPACGKMIKGCPCCPTMICPDCKTRFCFFHSNAHPSKNCWQYALRLRKDSQQSRRTVMAISRPCPRCSAPTEKNGGCNHITCSNCLHQWCWLCGTTYTDGHYEVYNIFGCPGGQFSRLGDVPFPAFILCLVVIPLRICCTLLLAPFFLLSALTLLTISLLWFPLACLLLLLSPCLSAYQNLTLGLSTPGKPRWYLLFPVLHQLFMRRSRLASDMVLSALVTALVLILIFLEACWLPMGILVFIASILGSWSCKDALSALFLPVYMLNALMSGRA